MEVAKITSKGQITIPIEIRKKLNLREILGRNKNNGY
ncbi:MAG: AbrB/MazE/SpoVT family DNA-binding domain-containing protein [Tepidanaerobacteraceae bacterium]|nr:AbrB/MazE/SpoVT family DNA-binding domain-containing protein [Tepidanaerobacteraceae bacterium]